MDHEVPESIRVFYGWVSCCQGKIQPTGDFAGRSQRERPACGVREVPLLRLGDWAVQQVFVSRRVKITACHRKVSGRSMERDELRLTPKPLSEPYLRPYHGIKINLRIGFS